MTVTVPDLSTLTLSQLFALLALVAAFDVLTAIGVAVTRRTFSLDAVALWLQSHVVARVFPIFALAVIGHGVPAVGVPPIEPAYALAIAGLAAYIAETVASIRSSFATPTAPTDATA